MDPYEKHCNELVRSKMFDKLTAIKRGEFKCIFKNGGAQPSKKYPKMSISQKQIVRFEGDRRREEILSKMTHFFTKCFENGQEKPRAIEEIDYKKKVQNYHPSNIDFILMKRKELEILKGKTGEDEIEGTTPSEFVELTAVEKIKEGVMRDWVNKCYESIKNPQSFTAKNRKMLADYDKKLMAIDSAFENIVDGEKIGSDENGCLDQDVISADSVKLSSEGSEGDLRKKVIRRNEAHQPGSKEIISSEIHALEKKRKVVDKRHEGITAKLEEFYIHDLKELESLAYDEELYILNPHGDISGSWRVNVKICEDSDHIVNVQFEGLLSRDKYNTTNCVYSSGLVDRFYCPLTEFRVEQTSGNDGNFSKTLFFHHEKQRKWHFDVRETQGRVETSNTFKLHYNQMLHVVNESAHILLMRKIVMYRYPLNFDQEHHKPECGKISRACTCPAGFPTRKRFVLKMRTLSITGQVCRANYRFYAPVRVKFHCQNLDVVRVRRRVEMQGQLVQSSNYYMTTAGQLVAITFNDPYPYDTPYYLQVDPKAVLDPSRVIPPDRIVPLRERYMYDPELKRYYEEEVKRLEALNKVYSRTHKTLENAMKTLLLDLLGDKPHRVSDYIQGFFVSLLR